MREHVPRSQHAPSTHCVSPPALSCPVLPDCSHCACDSSTGEPPQVGTAAVGRIGLRQSPAAYAAGSCCADPLAQSRVDDGAIPARFRTAIATALSPPRSGALLVVHVLSRSIHRASRAPPPCLPYATAALLLVLPGSHLQVLSLWAEHGMGSRSRHVPRAAWSPSSSRRCSCRAEWVDAAGADPRLRPAARVALASAPRLAPPCLRLRHRILPAATLATP